MIDCEHSCGTVKLTMASMEVERDWCGKSTASKASKLLVKKDMLLVVAGDELSPLGF